MNCTRLLWAAMTYITFIGVGCSCPPSKFVGPTTLPNRDHANLARYRFNALLGYTGSDVEIQETICLEPTGKLCYGLAYLNDQDIVQSLTVVPRSRPVAIDVEIANDRITSVATLCAAVSRIQRATGGLLNAHDITLYFRVFSAQSAGLRGDIIVSTEPLDQRNGPRIRAIENLSIDTVGRLGGERGIIDNVGLERLVSQLKTEQPASIQIAFENQRLTAVATLVAAVAQIQTAMRDANVEGVTMYLYLKSPRPATRATTSTTD